MNNPLALGPSDLSELDASGSTSVGWKSSFSSVIFSLIVTTRIFDSDYLSQTRLSLCASDLRYNRNAFEFSGHVNSGYRKFGIRIWSDRRRGIPFMEEINLINLGTK